MTCLLRMLNARAGAAEVASQAGTEAAADKKNAAVRGQEEHGERGLHCACGCCCDGVWVETYSVVLGIRVSPASRRSSQRVFRYFIQLEAGLICVLRERSCFLILILFYAYL